MVNSMEKEPL